MERGAPGRCRTGIVCGAAGCLFAGRAVIDGLYANPTEPFALAARPL
jgi:hypothetical protein